MSKWILLLQATWSVFVRSHRSNKAARRAEQETCTSHSRVNEVQKSRRDLVSRREPVLQLGRRRCPEGSGHRLFELSELQPFGHFRESRHHPGGDAGLGRSRPGRTPCTPARHQLGDRTCNVSEPGQGILSASWKSENQAAVRREHWKRTLEMGCQL